MYTPLMIRHPSHIQCLAYQFRRLFTLKFHPSLRISFESRSSRLSPLLSHGLILLGQVDAGHRSEFAEEGFDFRWSHSWGDARESW
eukprot:CCRYP_019358-RA/>CCRYP_019358-RA protein AED:0.14 eAED:0.14 QI:0/1/0.5/1/0/0/2/423/85